jgi:prostamide/prostaglandin F2alpha synthase
VKLSRIKPVLDAHGIALIGIGFDEEGYDEFVEGNYFSGNIYLSPDRKAYKAFELTKVGVMRTLFDFVTKSNGREAIKEGKELDIKFNFKSDGRVYVYIYILHDII